MFCGSSVDSRSLLATHCLRPRTPQMTKFYNSVTCKIYFRNYIKWETYMLDWTVLDSFAVLSEHQLVSRWHSWRRGSEQKSHTKFWIWTSTRKEAERGQWVARKGTSRSHPQFSFLSDQKEDWLPWGNPPTSALISFLNITPMTFSKRSRYMLEFQDHLLYNFFSHSNSY